MASLDMNSSLQLIQCSVKNVHRRDKIMFNSKLMPSKNNISNSMPQISKISQFSKKIKKIDIKK